MDFVLDENVPLSVGKFLVSQGHTFSEVRKLIPIGSPDELVAAVCQRLEAVLISFDGDFQKIAPRIHKAGRARFKRLSRIWMQCAEPQSVLRLAEALALIEREYALAQSRRDARMMFTVGGNYLKTLR